MDSSQLCFYIPVSEWCKLGQWASVSSYNEITHHITTCCRPASCCLLLTTPGKRIPNIYLYDCYFFVVRSSEILLPLSKWVLFKWANFVNVEYVLVDLEIDRGHLDDTLQKWKLKHGTKLPFWNYNIQMVFIVHSGLIKKSGSSPSPQYKLCVYPSVAADH